MQRFLLKCVIGIFAAVLMSGALITSDATTYTSQSSNRVTINLDTGWLYINANSSTYSGKSITESSFSKVCIPHSNVIMKHAYQSEDSFRVVTWYRRHITPPSTYSGRRFLLEFQAVSTVATVYVNGDSVGYHQGGYTPFTIDITGKITTAADNVIAVKVDSKVQSGVPPEGGNLDFMIFGGIVRHVNLIAADPLHVDWTFVNTNNPSQTAPSSPKVFAKTKVVNNSSSQKSTTVIVNIVDASNNVVATATSTQNVAAGGSYEFAETTSVISSPTLWTLDAPYLYNVYIQVQDGSAYIDEYKTRMGIRSITLNKTDGKCYVNGVAVKLRGLNRHETYPYIGRAASKRLQRKDADILKYDLGCNIVRTSHYPQSPDFLDRCDEIGMLVLEEVPGWMYVGADAWRKLEMQVLKDMIFRDRNHPSILTWGVRINESSDYNDWYQTMNDTARFYDPSRLTCGVRRSNSSPDTSFLEDIWTQNFLVPSSSPPNMPVISSEYAGHSVKPQAHSWDNDSVLVNQIMYDIGHGPGQNSSYAESKWAGLLGWCAFDYSSSHANATSVDTLPTRRNYMGYVSPHGVASIFRIPKFAGYFYQSQRDPTLYGPMVRICNYWTSSSPATVLVVSNCDQLALYLNDTLIGEKKTGNLYTSLPHPCFTWGVTYKSGELKAIGYINGVQAATHGVKTPGSSTGLTIVPDTNVIYEGGDMTRIIVSMVDAYGQVLYSSADSVTLSASGAGDFIGESKTALEGGQIAYYVKTRASKTGTITCLASAGGFSATTSISVITDPTTTSIGQVNRVSTALSTSKTWYRKVADRKIMLPVDAGKGSIVSIYDMTGRLIYKKAVTARSIDLTKIGAASGIHIVKIVKEFGNITK